MHCKHCPAYSAASMLFFYIYLPIFYKEGYLEYPVHMKHEMTWTYQHENTYFFISFIISALFEMHQSCEHCRLIYNSKGISPMFPCFYWRNIGTLRTRAKALLKPLFVCSVSVKLIMSLCHTSVKKY